jgi:putative serine protease PepD
VSTDVSPPAGPPKLGVLVAVALVGAVVGGLIVAFVARGSLGTPASRNGQPAACAAVDVAHDVLPSVVTVLTRGAGGSGNGTGEIVRTGGYILTNDHVIAAAADGGEVAVRYSDGTSSPAKIVGRDPLTDLAVLQAGDQAEGRPVIGIGSSSALQAGQPVVALGAPLGLSSTVTAGIVSALDRYVPVPAGDGQVAHLVDAIQTDASINPGNSGGPLVDCAGELIGVNTAIITVPNEAGVGGGGSVGLGFAIPVDLAGPLADQMIRTGSANHPTFGLQALPIAAEEGGASGLFVTVVDPGGPADAAGIQIGDVITEVDGQPATSVALLEKATITRSAGDTVPVTFVRDGRSSTAEVTLADSS